MRPDHTPRRRSATSLLRCFIFSCLLPISDVGVLYSSSPALFCRTWERLMKCANYELIESPTNKAAARTYAARAKRVVILERLWGRQVRHIAWIR
jgi:hypothetical protein